MKNKFGLGGFGKHLWTRDKAREVRTQLFKEMHRLDAGGTMVIDASGVEVFDYSFANELFGKTILALPVDFPGRGVLVEHLTEYTRENLEKALEGMGLAIVERKGSDVVLLGKVHTVDRNTFAAIAKAEKSVTAAELAESFGVNLTAMNERLSKLSSLGLVHREKTTSAAGREQYSYRAPE